MLFALLTACFAPDTSSADTAGDTSSADTAGDTNSADTAGDTSSADTAGDTSDCPAVAAAPESVSWTWPGEPVLVELEGCAKPLQTSCPSWVSVVAPEALDGAAGVQLAPIPGWAAPQSGMCTLAGVGVAVELVDAP